MNRFKVNDQNPHDNRGNKRKWKLNLFDRQNPDISLFNVIDAEQIRLAGSEVEYYRYSHDSDYDEVLGEDRGKVIEQEPILAYAHYTPTPIEQNLSEFGLEASNDQIFIFNKEDIIELIGREPIPGDQIVTEFQNVRYEIIEVQEDAFRIYGVYHYNCHAKILRDNDFVRGDDLESEF